jgi:hypothetical protein
VVAHLEGDLSAQEVPYDKLGQLIVLHNMLEMGLSMLLAAIAGTHNNGMILPIITTLDYNRKCELLKSFGSQFPTQRARIRKIADLAEKVGKGRNTAAHGVIGQLNGVWVIHQMAGAKMMAQRSGAPLVTVDELARLATTAADLIEQMIAMQSEFEQAHEAKQHRANQLAEIVRNAVADAKRTD